MTTDEKIESLEKLVQKQTQLIAEVVGWMRESQNNQNQQQAQINMLVDTLNRYFGAKAAAAY